MNKLTIATVTALTLSSLSFAATAAPGSVEQSQSSAGTERPSFGSLDTNGDRFITQEEATKKGIWQDFAAIDVNHDNKVSAQEYQAYMQGNQPGMSDDEMEEAE